MQGELFSEQGCVDRLREEYRRVLLGDGGCCPVCDRFGKVYGRRLNVMMVRSLVWIWRLSRKGLEWVDVPAAARAEERSYDYTKQYSTLKYWDLLVHKPNEDNPKQKESGIWKPRFLAGRFLAGLVPLPLKAYTYNDTVLRMSKEVVYVHDIIKGFDYMEIMASE